ncbi:MAG: carotenoid biosynthesis protein [Hymenobacteraceae bacterium]|nr:carotenoid biosynthesis protein [Hymenobacteraceae bacterium]MDX5397296.1 carotenoid biosynthesis protein [Hymenobacteraceae bacterium]MDX5513374.1 carotenoid biosynthesis protein [Hymenobacteraceae bacterium]
MSETAVTATSEAKQFIKTYKVQLAMAVLVVFYIVGFIGMGLSNYSAYFQQLTPFNLLLTNTILFAFHKRFSGVFLIFAGICMLTGFFAEIIGVHTQLLFGDYSYGSALGFKLWQVPVLISLNWLMLVYSTGHISHLFELPPVLRAAVGAGLMVLLDVFLEPVAMRYDFWNWSSGYIPVSNFIGWFGVAFLLQLCFQYLKFFKQNPLAPFVYLLQFFFFIGLWLLL